MADDNVWSAMRAPAEIVYDDPYAISPAGRRSITLGSRNSGNPDYFEESLSPDNQIGEALAKERFRNGSVSPWSLRGAMTDYARQLGLSQQALPIQPPYIRSMDTEFGDPLSKSGNFGNTMFVSDKVAGTPQPGGGPYSLDRAHIRIAPDTTPAERLLTARHELQHVKEYDQNMKQRGINGIDPVTSLTNKRGTKDHFISGSSDDIENSFVERPYLDSTWRNMRGTK